MHIYVNGRNIEITDAIKTYVKEKFSKVAAHYDQVQGIDVVRCEEAGESMYESIDLLADKLARQVQKFKEKSTGSDKSSIRTEAKVEEPAE